MGSGIKMAMALVLDLVAGEPPEDLHPVCWMGKGVTLAERIVDSTGSAPEARRIAGAVTAVGLPAGTYLATRAIIRMAPRRLAVVTEAALLGTAIAVRSLSEAARSVDEGMAVSLEEGRSRVARMVGRDTVSLDARGVIKAAVESVAENANDGVVAPMFYGFIGGAPLAMAYKMVNTLDSMIGYRDERYREFGWAAARLDDIAGYVPARLTALATVAASPLVRADAWGALRVWRRDGRRHDSPNAGVCESAFAGALGITLGGARQYGGHQVASPLIGAGLKPPQRGDAGRAASLMYGVAAATFMAGISVMWLKRNLVRDKSPQSGIVRLLIRGNRK